MKEVKITRWTLIRTALRSLSQPLSVGLVFLGALFHNGAIATLGILAVIFIWLAYHFHERYMKSLMRLAQASALGAAWNGANAVAENEINRDRCWNIAVTLVALGGLVFVMGWGC